jgi:hypothetical protein
MVYQRADDGVPTVYAREARALSGPFGSAVRVSDPNLGPAYDPGIAQLPHGDVIVTWSSAARVFCAARLGPNRYGPVRDLFGDEGGRVQEQTVGRFGGMTFVVYGFRPYDRPEELWDIRLRRLTDGPTVGSPVVVAREGPGPGTEGVQKRVTVAPTGARGGLIAVWSEHAAAPDGPRTISAALSTDDGTVWGPARTIASFPGHDLVNPFAISFAPDELRVYFAQDRNLPPLGYVRSTDRGRTWSGRRDVAMPKGATPARIVIAVDPSVGAVAVVAADRFTELGTFLLPG